ncbi:hypothetical protein B0A49_08151 [Cryomyces minteri]|uniref:Uncharacterized protein n=1 Tax=Cryomyces minteri TaxID=331657 RepID=A0A4V5NF77_9PEZI|nr:hypothetical protein B0A49_08151 [Cryomyces minteri]
MSRSNTMQSSTMQSHMYDQPEEQQFERIFLKLQAACDLATDALPICRYTFDKSRDLSERAMQVHATRSWQAILEKCDNVITAVQTLKERLSKIKLKDPAARAERGFWQICTTFVKAWKDLAEQAKHIGQDGLVTEHVKMLMKPIQKAVKEVSIFISASPWAYLASTGPSVLGPPISLAASEASTPAPFAGVPGFGLHGASTGVHAAGAMALHHSASAAGSAYGAPNNSHTFTHNAALPTPGYATPLSAALGPAAQATVPSTPGGAQGQMQGPGGHFQGTGIVFERADRLLAGGMAGRRG